MKDEGYSAQVEELVSDFESCRVIGALEEYSYTQRARDRSNHGRMCGIVEHRMSPIYNY
jgi:hypothetical protein